MLVNFFIPVLSLVVGIILLLGKKIEKKYLLSYKSYVINLNAKNFLFICPILFIITIIVRSYCLNLTASTHIFNISLLIIQIMIVFNFTLITNITTEADFDDNGNIVSNI